MANAVFQRELKIGLRSQRAFLAQVVFVICLSLVMLLAWPKGEHVGVEATLSRSLFVTLAVSMLALITLLAPVFIAGSLTTEKEAGTLELLLVSPIAPAQVALGKLSASLLYLVLLVLSALPVLGLCYFLGGVGGDEVVALGMHLLGFTLLLGGIGLTASAVCGRTHGSLVVTYLFAVPLGTCMVLAALGRKDFYQTETAIFLNALEAFALLILFGHVVHRLSKPAAHARPAEEERPEEQAVICLQRNYFPDCFLWPERPKGYLPDGTNPVYMKEVTCEIFGRGTGLVRTILVGTLVLSMIAGFFLSADNGPVFYSFLNLCVLLIAPAFAANAFTQERERGTFDMLRTSLLTPWQILGGKFFAIVRFMGVLTLFLLVPVPIALMTGKVLVLDLLLNLAIVFATLLVCTATGLLASLALRSSVAAMVGTYGTVFVFGVAPVAAFAVLDQFTKVPPSELVSWGFTSPFLASLTLTTWGGRADLFQKGAIPNLWLPYLLVATTSTAMALLLSWWRLSRSEGKA